MKQPAIFPKVAKEMFSVQMSWTVWFLGIVFAVNIIKIISAINQNTEVDNLYNAVFVAGTIYMLIIGIISISFLRHYVENGVTRKDYFKGTLLAALGLSIIIPLIAYMVSQLQLLLLKNIETVSVKTAEFNSVVLDVDDHIIGEIVTSIVFAPYIDPQNHAWLALAVFSINLFTYYVLGWFISVGFYRFHAGAGLAFIFIALIIVSLEDVFLRVSLDLPVLSRYEMLESLPAGILLLFALLLIVLALSIIRLLTKRVAIKI